MLSDGEACGEAGGFDTNQIDESGVAFVAFVGNYKIPDRIAWLLEFWPYSCLIGMQIIDFQEGEKFSG